MKPRRFTNRGLSGEAEDYYWDYGDGSKFDPNDYLYWDEYGNAWDVLDLGWWDDPPVGQDFTADGYDAAGNVVVRITTSESGDLSGNVDLHELGNSLDWWNVNQGAPIVLPAITYDAGYILTVPSTTLASDPNAPPALKVPGNWDKIKQALQTIAKNGRAVATSGGASAGGGGKPSTVAASQQGQCPQGYAKNAAGQCQLIPTKQTGGLSDLLSNPLLLILGIIAVAVISKK